MNLLGVRTIGVVFLGLILLVTGYSIRAAHEEFIPSSVFAQSLTCTDILQQAYTSIQSSCSNLGRNEVCYANSRVDASLDPASLQFAKSGDVVNVQNVRSLFTYPLDLAQGTWGVSLLKLQANLPDTMPGQNVTFLVYGNTTLENISGDMRAFYFSSGLGVVECNEAPDSGILVRSPQHTEVVFTVNGVEVKIASTVVLHARPNETLDVYLLEGSATITSVGSSQTLQPGEFTSVQLGGANGLDAVSTPSNPQIMSPDASLTLPSATIEQIAVDVSSSVIVEGCITAINGNVITINGDNITVPEVLLPQMAIGSCYHIEGDYQISPAGWYILPNVLQPLPTGDTNSNISSSPPSGMSSEGGMGNAPSAGMGMGDGMGAPPSDGGMGMGDGGMGMGD